MPPAAAPSAPVLLVHGEDDFAVKQRARQIFEQWSGAVGGMDHEKIDASVSNSGEALKVLAKLREALQTLPFFGTGKVVWLQNCNFFGDERAATSQVVTEALAELSQELKAFSWKDVQLLVSAGKVDKRKTFYKTLEKIGSVEAFAGWSIDDRDWVGQAELWVRRNLRERSKDISDEALSEFVAGVGPNMRLLDGEVEKLALYVGERKSITRDDVLQIATRGKQARAFALGDALGDRDLPRLLRCLDDELWELQFDNRKSEIGLLYGLTAKIRVLIFLQEMLKAGWLRPEADFSRFKTQLSRVPAADLPTDKRFNPLAQNPYVLFKALPQAQNYSSAELVAAMNRLLACNQQLIFSNLDEALVLQQALVQIVSRPGEDGDADAEKGSAPVRSLRAA
jgi:DNA polymerase-3 subunit delta